MKFQTLYHGSTKEFNFDEFKENSFFSTSQHFSNDYGIVNAYRVETKNTFSSTNKKDIEQLLQITNLYDNYNDIEISSWDEYLKATNQLSDTWEVIEEYLNTIKSINSEFDSIQIIEGGVENIIIFTPEQIKKKIPLPKNKNKFKTK